MIENDGRVERAFAAAEVASQETYHELLKTWPLMPDGKTRDGCGLVSTFVRASRKLKRELRAMKRTSGGRGLTLCVSGFDVPDPGITAQEKACQAACDILNEQIGDLGQFYVVSRLD